ncbi:MAG: hypothetical protein ACKPKO_32910, partial [Candidatus Fonsibacter sp.]
LPLLSGQHHRSITIFDQNFAYVSRKWLYTAVTKATNRKQVYFYDYEESAEKEKEMMQYLCYRKVENYKLQVKKANRSIDDASFIKKRSGSWAASASPVARAATASPTTDRTER